MTTRVSPRLLRSRKSGFSLMELLVVMAIATTLITLAGPALSGLFQQNFSGKVENMQFLIRQAKSTAMAQNTFVLLGFSPSTVNGSPSLVVGAVASTNGLNVWASASPNPPLASTYRSVMKPLILSNLQLIPNSLSNANSSTDIANSTYTFSQTVAGQNINFTSVIAFSPDGSASLSASSSGPYYRCIGIGMQPGPASAAHAQIAAIQVSGLSAQPTLFRQ